MCGLFTRWVLGGVWMLALSAGAQERFQVKTEAGTIAFDNEGRCWLSFVVTRPKLADLGVKLKVTRPEAGSPEPGLPAAVVGPQGRGSWIWIGEGDQKGMAALFTLAEDGHVTWVALTPRIALEYLRPAGRGDSPFAIVMLWCRNVATQKFIIYSSLLPD
jgi:hypothetical protein